MNTLIPISSRRARLEAIVTAHAAPAAIHDSPLAALCKADNAEPIRLRRSCEARSLSRERYRRAEQFMPRLASGASADWPNFLYRTGITAQLALSSHLIDVGFADDWCARYVGLHVARSLAYANATGLGYECAETAKLAHVLTPYWKWNCRALADNRSPNDGGFTCEDVHRLLDALLEHVGQITGHGHARHRIRPKVDLTM